MTVVPITAGAAGAGDSTHAVSRDDQLRLGLWMFLATVTMLFAAFTSAYIVRRSGADWRTAPLPPLLWVNTVVLGASSAVLEWAASQGRQRRWTRAVAGCVAAALFGLGFVAGQLMVWREMVAAGQYLSSNPYSAFVYMMTAAHAVHVLVALIVLMWGAAVTRSGWQHPAAWQTRMELCRTFWHYLGAVWIFLFAFVSAY